jgi:hypothetical protein
MVIVRRLLLWALLGWNCSGLRLAQPGGPTARVSALPFLPEDRRRSSFWNIVILLKYRRWTKTKKPLLQSIMHHHQKPSDFIYIYIYIYIYIALSTQSNHNKSWIFFKIISQEHTWHDICFAPISEFHVVIMLVLIITVRALVKIVMNTKVLKKQGISWLAD